MAGVFVVVIRLLPCSGPFNCGRASASAQAQALSKGKPKQLQAKWIREEATSVATISPSTLDACITSKVGQMMDEHLAPLLEFLKHPQVLRMLPEKAAPPPKAGPPLKAATPPRPTATARISPLRASESDGRSQ